MILYNLKASLGDQFTITKFDDDMNVESSYSVSDTGCACPQGHKPTCRHRKMLPTMLPIVDTDRFYCYDDRTYRSANGQMSCIPDPDLPQQAQPVPSPATTPTTTTFRRRV